MSTLTPSIDLSHLPHAARGRLFGRERLPGQLDALWLDPATRVVGLIGPAGIGKSTVLGHWVSRIVTRAASEGVRIFGWRFGSPDGRSDQPDTIERFLDAIEAWLSIEPCEGSALTRATRIANALSGQVTLLALDGVESLYGAISGTVDNHGDRVLECLLSTFRGPGLCVVGSRLELGGLRVDVGYRSIQLAPLSAGVGARLLCELGVRGLTERLESAADMLGGHPLSIELCGRYLATFEEGDVRRLDRVALNLADADEKSRVERIVAGVEARLEPAAMQVLRIACLDNRLAIDRDAFWYAVETLRQPPVVGLTDAIDGLGRRGVRAARRSLVNSGLLAPAEHGVVSVHALIRALVSRRFESAHPASWREAHRRLAADEIEQSRQAPGGRERGALIRAIRYLCIAGEAPEALAVYLDVFGDDHPVSDEQGALSLSLEALLPFFDADNRARCELDDAQQAKVYAKLGFRLQALGRLDEAVEPMERSAKGRIALEDWHGAANSAGNLSSLLLTLGQTGRAEKWGHRAVACADKGADGRQRVSKRAILVEALHRRGKLDEAHAVFVEAERIQREWQADHPILGSIMGYRVGALLLHLGEVGEVERRARADRVWSEEQGFLLAVALDDLLLGHCERRRGCLEAAAMHFDASVEQLVRCGRIDHQPRGLIARAALRRETGDWEEAAADLRRAEELARLGGMKIYRHDIAVERLWLRAARAEPLETEAIDRLRTAMKETGYACRFGDLTELQAECC